MAAPTDPLHPDNATKVSIPALAVHMLTYISTRGPSTFTGRREFIAAQRNYHWGENTEYVGRPKQNPDPDIDADTYSHAVSAAFDWLYVEGLIQRHWDPGDRNRTDEFFIATEPGERFLKRGDRGLVAHRAEKLLGFHLHASIDGRIRQLFLTGETEAAVLVAMKEVEVRMRDAGSLGNDLVGVGLATAAFKPGAGPLHDDAAEKGEQEAVMALFRGAMGTFRNPVAHRRVDYDDPLQAVEVILFADLLLRMIDRAATART